MRVGAMEEGVDSGVEGVVEGHPGRVCEGLMQSGAHGGPDVGLLSPAGNLCPSQR